MAVTILHYNHTRKLVANGEVDIANLKAMLLNDDSVALFDPTDTSIDQVAGVDTPPRANEVSGNGWTAGGEALASAAVTTVNTDEAKLDAPDIAVTATGGAIGPAESLVIWDATNGFPLYFVDFGQAETAGETTDFKVVWNGSGIATWTAPA